MLSRRRRTRRRLSLTSLIDVIFLLLLFFMLSSTFTRFSEVTLTSGGAGGTNSTLLSPMFLRLSEDALSLNGRDVTLVSLPGQLRPDTGAKAPRDLLISMRDTVSAQRLTDLLVVLHGVAGLRVTVLEPS